LAHYVGALVEIAEIVAIALTLGGGSLLQSAVGFGFGLFVDRDSLSGSGNIHFAAVDTFCKLAFIFDSRPCHSAWEKCYDSLTVVGLHGNWTLALRCQVSAQPPAKKTVGQI